MLTPSLASKIAIGILALALLLVGLVVGLSGIFTNELDPLQANIRLTDETTQGPQGYGIISLNKCDDTVPPATPAAPNGGTWDLGDDRIDWSMGLQNGWVYTDQSAACNAAATPPELHWLVDSDINPATADDQSRVTLTWGTPYERTGATGLPGPQGSTGPTGPQGPQGIYTVQLYTTTTDNPPAAPSTVQVTVSTGVVVSSSIPAGWGVNPVTPTQTNERIWVASDDINPSTDSGTVTLVLTAPAPWSGPQGLQGIQGQQGDQGDQGDQGTAGSDGSDGAQGTYRVFLYNTSNATPTSRPTATITVATGAASNITTGWYTVPPVPTLPIERIWASFAEINPSTITTATVDRTFTLPAPWSGARGSEGPTGPEGPIGPSGGPQGIFRVYLFNTTSAASLTAPSSTITLGTNGTPTLSNTTSGWTVSASDPADATERIWIASTAINPATHTGSVTTTFSAPAKWSGARGTQGLAGTQGIYTVALYGNFASPPTSSPTADVTVSTGVIANPSAGYSDTPSTPAAGERTYRATAQINPASETGTVSKTFSTPSAWSGATGPQGAGATVSSDALLTNGSIIASGSVVGTLPSLTFTNSRTLQSYDLVVLNAKCTATVSSATVVGADSAVILGKTLTATVGPSPINFVIPQSKESGTAFLVIPDDWKVQLDFDVDGSYSVMAHDVEEADGACDLTVNGIRF